MGGSVGVVWGVRARCGRRGAPGPQPGGNSQSSGSQSHMVDAAAGRQWSHQLPVGSQIASQTSHCSQSSSLAEPARLDSGCASSQRSMACRISAHSRMHNIH